LHKKSKILIVGQTPPPFGGQAIMIERILHFQYDDITFFHVKMNFSSDMNDIGRVQFKKIFELIRVVCNIYKFRIFHNVKILYYPPAGPNTVPILRDIVILFLTRFLFKKTIFHFHAGGLSNKFAELKPVIQWSFKKAYFYPDLTIRLSKLNPEDGKFLNTKTDVVIPYGIDDFADKCDLNKTEREGKVHILYTGVLKDSKGVSVLINAIGLIVNSGHANIIVSLMGKFDSNEYELELRKLISEKKLDSYVRILGVKTGTEKLKFFHECDIFCFPSYFESETFGIVLLEAMQFSKAVVATNWRGIPDVVKHEESGFLVEINNVEQLSQALIRVITDEKLRISLGSNGRKLFKEKFTVEVFKQNFYDAIKHCI